MARWVDLVRGAKRLEFHLNRSHVTVCSSPTGISDFSKGSIHEGPNASELYGMSVDTLSSSLGNENLQKVESLTVWLGLGDDVTLGANKILAACSTAGTKPKMIKLNNASRKCDFSTLDTSALRDLSVAVEQLSILIMTVAHASLERI